MITIDKKNYILADDIIEKCPVWCKGVRNGREFIKKKEVSNKYFEYARFIDEQWNITDGKCIKYDKVLVRKLYLDKCDEYANELSGNVTYKNGIVKAPDVIYLDDTEKFTDNEGNVLEIETRGIREHNYIYFKVKDVANSFGMKRLQDIIIDNRNTYTIDIDYKYFICLNPGNNVAQTKKRHIVKKIPKLRSRLTP